MYGKAPTFRRSSERNNAGDQQAAAEMDRLVAIDAETQKREDELEALACGVSGAGSGGLVARSSISDESRYDLEGLVRP